MRRLFLSSLGLSWLALLTGCHHWCSHGVCDCLYDDHCCTRAPWVKFGPPAALGAPVDAVPGDVVPAPAAVPPPVIVPPITNVPTNDLP